ncbi:MAG: hypothetical protein K2J37_04520 [Ruminococcus sp.]|nr:hypothetical protein [Ruminococcus sp.]
MSSKQNNKLKIIRLIEILIFIVGLFLASAITISYQEKIEDSQRADRETKSEIQSAVTSVSTFSILSESVTTSISEIYTTAVVTTQTTMIPYISTPYCKAAALYCVDDEQLLYSYNIDERIAPASLTKLLTSSVVLEYLSTDEILTVGSEQSLVQPYSSLCGLQYGSTASFGDFVTGMLMASGNDAAYTIAVSAARLLNPDDYLSDIDAVNYFCRLMNEFAENIGMKNSNFANPDGWDNDNHYTTVSDLIILAEYVLENPYIRNTVSMQNVRIPFLSGEVYEWTNSNLLLSPDSDYYRENSIGIKTGTTKNAGNCLISAFEINGKTYVSVVAGCEEDSDRYELTLKIIDSIT